jgi:YVTN family beta-propeller protein
MALDFSYSAPEGGLGRAETLRLDRPDRFLHFVVGLATEGVPVGARTARLGGRWGMLAPASSVEGYQGAYFANHVRFVWREHGVRYVATLHTFGERATETLLGQIIAGLVPASQLHARTQPPNSAVVGPSPTGIAIDANGVWVATAGNAVTDFNGQLAGLSPASLRPRLHPRIFPKAIRVAIGDGAVWTVSYDVTPDGQNLTPPQLARVDPSTGQVTARLGLPPGEATGIAVSDGTVWVTIVGADRQSHGALLRVGPSTMRVLTRTPVGRGTSSIAADERSIWVVNAASNTLTRLDARTGRLEATVPVGRHPFDVAIGAGSVWVTNVADGTVSRIDPATNRAVATIPVGHDPYGITTDPHGIWVAVLGAGTIARIDPHTNTVTGQETVRGDPLAIAADGHDLYVTLNTEGLLLRIDPTSIVTPKAP